MQKRRLRKPGLEVSVLGLGRMGMSYGAPSDISDRAYPCGSRFLGVLATYSRGGRKLERDIDAWFNKVGMEK